MKTADLRNLPIRLGIALLLIVGASTAWMLMHERDARRWLTHTAEVREELADFRIVALRAEVFRRGYLITGNKADLNAYASASRTLTGKLATLRELTTDNTSQQRRIEELGGLLAESLATGRRVVVLREQGHALAAAAWINEVSSRERGRRMAVLAESILSEEIRLDASRRQRAARLEAMTFALFGGSGLIILIVMVLAARDRKQRIHALEALNERLEIDNVRRQAVESELALLANNATDAVFRVGLDGRFLYASPSVVEIIGVGPDDLVGKSLFSALHPDDEVAVFTGLHRLRVGEAERVTLSYRVRLPRRADAWTWLEASSGIIRDEFGAPLEIIASIRNIDRRKQLEFDLREARRVAENATAAKSAFLANMSHEIRTPMNGVVGFADLLLATPLTADQQRYVRLIAESGDALTRLLNDILDFSKVEAGQMTIADEMFDLPGALGACATLIAPVLLAKHVELSVELADELPRYVRGDALRLRQILLNLLGNAAKFTSAGKVTLRARVDCSDQECQLFVEVEDTGIGIPAEQQAAIFDPFVQADTGIAASFGGTGLGLPISVQLTHLMGGTLALSSEAGRGTLIVLTLPLVIVEASPREVSEATAPARPAPTRTGKHLTGSSIPARRVLVAEDHDINQLLVRAILRQLGCRVDIAADGASAVEMVMAAAASDPYAMVLMDLQMPVMGGLDATRTIRLKGFDAGTLPIVAFTANAYADDIAACLDAGMQDHVAKPLKMADIAAMLEKWTNGSPDAAAPPAIAPPATGVRARYALRKAQTMEKLEMAAGMPVLDGAAIDELSDLLHKLAGTAGMFGEEPLGDQARDLEDKFKAGSADECRAALIAALPNLRAAS